MGLITDICFAIDAYNNIERSEDKSLLLRLKQHRTCKNLKRLIKKFEDSVTLDVDILNDFYFNYMGTLDTIGELDNCECVYNDNQKQFIFTVKNANGAVAFSTHKGRDPIIGVTVHQYSALDVKNFNYTLDFKPRLNSSQGQNDLGEFCERLLKDCIANYLRARLDLYKEE